ncbi:MAG: ribose-5-phosphate isomerase RpiA [Methanobacteriota archaeon]|nr:MAG: ribose-5-phosphate isomerase RpiA [Euryarchaeota archaeon]
MPLDVPGQKRAAAEAAVALVKKGYVVGLGTGSTAKYAILKLGDMAQDGFEVRGVPTSMATANLAKEHGIPLTSLEECPKIDLTIDGADEVDPHLDMIKGMGGALFREKLVAAASKTVAIAVDASKLVKKLGSRAPVPVEVHPFGWRVSKARLEALGGAPELRTAGAATYRTDNDNYILDTRFKSIKSPADLEQSINNVPGVVENGLFVGVATVVFVADAKGVTTRKR